MFYFDIIIPAYNEEESIAFTLQPLISLQKNPIIIKCSSTYITCLLRYIWVVDNSSQDQTSIKAKELGAKVIYCSTQGYGAACLRALDELHFDSPDAVVFMDADASDDVADLPDLLQTLLNQSADLVIGSRVQKAQKNSLTALQRFGNTLSCRLIDLLFNVHFTDLGPFRVIRWSALQALSMQDLNFGWTVEMQTKAASRNLKIVEIPVNYRPRYAGESKISGQLQASIKAGYKILSTIGKEYLKHRIASHASIIPIPSSTQPVSTTLQYKMQTHDHQALNSSDSIQLCILAKAPILGQVKTRLCSHFSQQQAHAIHIWCIETLWENTSHLHPQLHVTESHDYWYTLLEQPSSKEPTQRLESAYTHRQDQLNIKIPYQHPQLYLQKGKHLGEKMSSIMADNFKKEVEYTVLVGSDCPHLPRKLLQETQRLLIEKNAEVIIGPACDGGYYLIAIAKQAWPRAEALFEEVEWGSDQVLQQTLSKAQTAQLQVILLPFYYDLDHPSDIHRLIQHYQTNTSDQLISYPQLTSHAFEKLVDITGFTKSSK
jgi:rSAM/selenodomain-associated transferase 1